MRTICLPPWIKLILASMILITIQLSCRFIPTSKTNPESTEDKQHTTITAIATIPQPGTDSSSNTSPDANLTTNWKIQNQIGGNTYASAFIPGTELALIGVGSRIVLLDTSELFDPSGNKSHRIGQVWQSDILPGVVRSISATNQYVYVAAGKGHILIFDISNPSNIQQVSDLNDYAWAMSLVIKDNRLFVADNNQGLWVADITDPVHPVPFITDSLKIAAVGLAYKDPNLYLVDISGKLLIYDLSDPAKFNLIGQLDLPQLSTDLVIDGDYAFLSAGQGGLWVVDISNPSTPVKIADRQSPMSDGIIKVGKMIYLTDYTQGLLTFDISRPADPQLVKSQDIPLFNQGVPGKRGLSVMDDLLMIANPNEGAVFINLKSPAEPKLIGKFVAPLSGAAFDLKCS